MSEHYTPQEMKLAKCVTLLVCAALSVAVGVWSLAVVTGHISPMTMMMPAMMILMMSVMQSTREGDPHPSSVWEWAGNVFTSWMTLSIASVVGLILARLGVLLTLTETSVRGLVITVLVLGGGFAAMAVAVRSFRKLRELLRMEVPTEKFTHRDEEGA